MVSRNQKIRHVLRNRQRELCCYCGIHMARAGVAHRIESERLKISNYDVTLRTETIEHLRRKSDGGSDRIDNLALACAECNHGRGDMDWLSYKSLKMGESQELKMIAA